VIAVTAFSPVNRHHPSSLPLNWMIAMSHSCASDMTVDGARRMLDAPVAAIGNPPAIGSRRRWAARWQVAATTRRHGRHWRNARSGSRSSTISFGSRGQRAFRRLAALAEALDIRYEFNGLENLRSVGTRPVVLFANHPTGGGQRAWADASAGEPVSRLSDSRKSAHEVSCARCRRK